MGQQLLMQGDESAGIVVTPEDVLAQHLDSWEACTSEWISRREDISKNQFVLGLIASTVETKYKDKTLATFAKDVNETVDTVYLYRDVYRKCYQYLNRFKNLSWSHYAIVAKARTEQEESLSLLKSAADGEWSTRQLKREVGKRKVTEELGRDVPYIDPQMASAISHWRELRPSIVKFAMANPQFWAYTDDYVEDVDDAIKKPWLSAREFVERLIFAGYREVEFLAQKSRWTKETIERLCGELVEEGTHEWRHKGGKSEDARGARPPIIVPVTEPAGD